MFGRFKDGTCIEVYTKPYAVKYQAVQASRYEMPVEVGRGSWFGTFETANKVSVLLDRQFADRSLIILKLSSLWLKIKILCLRDSDATSNTTSKKEQQAWKNDQGSL